MTEILNPLERNKSNIINGQENALLRNKKNCYQQPNESPRSSTSSSSLNEVNNYTGLKSEYIERNNSDETSSENQSQRKHSAPTENENFFLNFEKIGKETRSYFNKLYSKGYLTLNREKTQYKVNKIFIFDWDDTLLCTSMISPGGYFDDNLIILPNKLEKIKTLETIVKKLLTITTEKGDTFIITNSEPGWVEYSCKRFFPNILDLLSKIKIISARGLYEKKFPNNYKTWKNMAFNDIIKNYELNLPSNIMCMGDSTYEMEAAHGLANKFPDGFIKAIKFKEFPKIEELISQLNLILDKFDFIYSACKNWTITIDKKKKK